MKFLGLILLVALASVSGKEEEKPPEPTMAFVHHLTLADSKICGDGETVQIQCGLNIMERLPIPECTFIDESNEKYCKDLAKAQKEAEKAAEEAAKEAEKAAREAEKAAEEAAREAENQENNSNLRRRRLPEEEPEEEPVEVKLFSSDVYEMEITNCTSSIKGQNRDMNVRGRQLVVEAEGFENVNIASVDPYNNTEQLMTRQGRIKFWEQASNISQLLGYNKSDHVGNLLFKVVIERKQVIDQTEMFVGMALTMQAMADAIMLNDTGVMFPEPVPTYKNYTRVVSVELDWEHLVSVVCSPEKFATAMPTPQPSHEPSMNPSAPSIAPSMEPSSNPSLSLVPSDMPSTVPSPAPSDIPSTIPSSLPSKLPSTVPSSLPSTLPSSGPTGAPTSGPTSAPTTTDFDPLNNPQNNQAIPGSGGTTNGSGVSPSRGPSLEQQFNRPLFDRDSVVDYTREYYGSETEPHDADKPDLITP